MSQTTLCRNFGGKEGGGAYFQWGRISGTLRYIYLSVNNSHESQLFSVQNGVQNMLAHDAIITHSTEIDTFLSKVGKHLEDDINVAVSFGNIYSVFTSKLETMTKDGATMMVKTEQYLQHSVQLTDSEGENQIQNLVSIYKFCRPTLLFLLLHTDTLPVPEKIRELYPAPPKYNELKTKVTIPYVY